MNSPHVNLYYLKNKKAFRRQSTPVFRHCPSSRIALESCPQQIPKWAKPSSSWSTQPLLLLILSPPHLTTPPLCLAADGVERPCSSAAPSDLRRGLLATPLTALPRRSRRGALASRTDSPRHLLLHGLPSHLLPHSCRPPPVALRSPPPFTCLDADQDACFHLDSLSSSSRPRRTTPIGALVAAALGHVSGNRRRGRQVFFHVNFIPSFLLIPRRTDNLVACGMVHPVSERPAHVDSSN
jgi:hypothetical protein